MWIHDLWDPTRLASPANVCSVEEGAEVGGEFGVKPASSTGDRRLLPLIQAAARRTGKATTAETAHEEPSTDLPDATADPAAADDQKPPAASMGTEGEPIEKPPSDPAMQPTWSDLQRRDRELRTREQQISQHRQSATKWDQLQAQLAKDPLAALQSMGVDQGRVLDAIIAKQGTAAPDGDLLGELRALREEVKELKAGTQQTAASLKYETREQDRIRRILGASDAEVVKLAAESSDDVVDEIINEASQEWDRLGRPQGWRPDYSKVIQSVESRYTAQALALTEQMLRARVVKDKVMEWLKVPTTPPGKATPPASSTAPTAGTRPPPATLDNSLDSTQPPSQTKKLATIEEKRQAFLSHVHAGWEKAKERQGRR